MSDVKSAYRDAIGCQDACNLSGVVHAFSRALTAIWGEARSKGEGTDYVNQHPVVCLFLDKLNSLYGGASQVSANYFDAYSEVSKQL